MIYQRHHSAVRKQITTLSMQGTKYLTNEHFKYNLAAKCSKNDARRKTHLYTLCINLISASFFSHRFCDSVFTIIALHVSIGFKHKHCRYLKKKVGRIVSNYRFKIKIERGFRLPFRLIQHLSYPEGNSINDFICAELSSVKYL